MPLQIYTSPSVTAKGVAGRGDMDLLLGNAPFYARCLSDFRCSSEVFRETHLAQAFQVKERKVLLMMAHASR